MKTLAQERGYMAGYMHKQAAPGIIGDTLSRNKAGLAMGAAGTAAGGVGALWKAILPWLIVAPPAAGAGLGLLHSKYDSPTMIDQENVQRALESAELDEALSDLTRRKAQAKLQESNRDKKIKAGKGEHERSLHI